MINTREREKSPDKEREIELVKELYRKGWRHYEIAICLQRGRKIFKWEPTDIEACTKEVMDIILKLCRRRVD